MRFATAADRAQVDALMNDPIARVWKSYDGAPAHCDPEPFLTPPSFTLMCDGGCFPVQAMGHRRYAVHANLMARGAAALALAREGIAFIFKHTDAEHLLAFVPKVNPRARWFAAQLGFRFICTLVDLWPVAGKRYGVDVLRLSKETP